METKVNDVKQYWKKRSISAKIDLTVQRNDYRSMEVSKNGREIYAELDT